MILTPREAPYENSGELVTASCITDITFGCIPKISLLSEFDTEHAGHVLFPHSQEGEGDEAGKREV